MGLEEYRRKRDFARTPEPGAEPAPGRGGLFVVQRHAARRLHWDFRLELDGVLKSWAVTREPVLDPAVKRLAVETEDHPLDYADFEGDIPAGQYGAGHVDLWDRGRWWPVGDPRQGMDTGVLKFRLDGGRLKGGFALVRMKDGGRRPNWLLVKEHDGPDQPRPADPPTVGPVAGARPAPLAPRLSPMLATPVGEAPAGGQWLHEIKFDGYRLLARVEGGACRLFTRAGHDWTDRFPAIARACAGLPCAAAWLDGEVVALDQGGVSRFHALQRQLAAGSEAGLVYHVFDLVALDGQDLAGVAQEERKRLLRALLARAGEPLRYTDHMDGRGPDFYRQACAFALEGVVSKRRDRPYRPGRGKDWVKAKCVCRQEFVVAGFTRPEKKKSGLAALLLAVWDGGRLVAAGRVGTGFSADEASMLEARLVALPSAPALSSEPRAVWVRPTLVVEVEFTEWTADGALRHPSYQGLRLDRDAGEVVREPCGAALPAPPAADRLGGLTNPDRVLFADFGLTKRRLAAYYLEVAPRMLPLVAGRPLTLRRCPDGTGGNCFWQRHPHPGMAKAVRRIPAGDEVLVAVDDEDGLVGLAQMGALEVHAWGSTAADLERPDLLVMDLDPDEGLAWARVTEAAMLLKDRLAALGLAAFAKTTGGKGLHVVVPLVPRAGWDEAKAFTKRLAESLAADAPDRFTANMAKTRRKGRIFVDYLRNQRSATAVAPYSTRARPGAPVAVPLTWAELAAGIRSDHFTVETLPRRLAATPDPWAGFAIAAAPLPDRL
ncbi:MAG: DNA ligase D [Actinomycetota bacterium]